MWSWNYYYFYIADEEMYPKISFLENEGEEWEPSIWGWPSSLSYEQQPPPPPFSVLSAEHNYFFTSGS